MLIYYHLFGIYYYFIYLCNKLVQVSDKPDTTEIHFSPAKVLNKNDNSHI